MRDRSILAFTLLAVSLVLAPHQSSAALITATFEGVALPGSYYEFFTPAGDTTTDLTGTTRSIVLSFDTNATRIDISQFYPPGAFIYPDGFDGMTSITGDQEAVFVNTDGSVEFLFEFFDQSGFYSNLNLAGPLTTNSDPSTLNLGAIDLPDSTFSDYQGIHGEPYGEVYLATFALMSLTITGPPANVPEPSGLLVFSTALGLLGTVLYKGRRPDAEADGHPENLA